MEHKPQSNKAHEESNKNPANKGVPIVRKLEWDLWANSGWAVLGLVWAMFFLTPIFDFVGEHLKIYLVTVGVCGIFSVCAFWFAHSFVLHQDGRSASHLEAQAEEDKVKMQAKIDHLESDLSELQSELREARRQLKEQESRSLTDEQYNEIVSTMLPFAGQKATIQCVESDSDGIRYAQQFYLALREAKWDISPLEQSRNFGDFDNVLVVVAKEHVDRQHFPISMIVLVKVLAKLNIAAPDQLGWIDGIPAGEIRVRIGMRPRTGRIRSTAKTMIPGPLVSVPPLVIPEI